MLGPNICSTAGSDSTTLAAESTPTSNGSLSSAHDRFIDSNCRTTSNAESVGIPGSSPWAIKWTRGAGVPSIGPYDAITLMSPVIFGIVGGFTLTSVAYFGGGGGKADNGVSAETTAAAENPIPITQTG
uniref:Uncharacterized protein n=1 Tax=Romanomermis culicivorax TaxID=13658 RepID=A0A915HRI7_ROMCU